MCIHTAQPGSGVMPAFSQAAEAAAVKPAFGNSIKLLILEASSPRPRKLFAILVLLLAGQGGAWAALGRCLIRAVCHPDAEDFEHAPASFSSFLYRHGSSQNRLPTDIFS